VPDQQPSQHQKGETESSGRQGNLSRVEDQKEIKKTETASSQKQYRLDNFLRWASFAVDVLVFVAVALYAVMAYQQWKEMKLDRRAWVSIQNIKGFPEAMKPFRVTLVVANTGRTFAKHLTIVATGHYYGPDETPNFSAEIKEEAKKGDREMISDALLAPNAAVEATVNQQDKVVAISEKGVDESKNAIREGKSRFLLFGQATYQDIFGHQHWLIFSYRLLYDPLQTENGGWSWGTYKGYNETGPGNAPE
jgi:hypothetical protein